MSQIRNVGWRHVAALLLAFLAVIAFTHHTVKANSFVVSSLSDSGPDTLRAAVNNANFSLGSDTITFNVTGTIHLLSELVVQDDVIIAGPGSDQLIVDAGGSGRVLRSNIVSLSISGLTLQGGSGVSTVSSGLGGALLADGPLTMSHMLISNNTANTQGAGVYASQSALIDHVQFINNRGLSAGSQGGGLFAQGSLVISDSAFLGNQAVSGGGLMFDRQDAGYIVNSLFARNSGSSGAALFLASQGGVVIANTTIASPTLSSLTAIYTDKGSVSMLNTIVANYTTGFFKNRVDNAVVIDHGLFYNVANIAVNNAVTLTNPIIGDPHFIMPSADNYHLGRGSAGIDAGLDIGVNDDFEGDIRPIGPGFDIGYDEARLMVFLPAVGKE